MKDSFFRGCDSRRDYCQKVGLDFDYVLRKYQYWGMSFGRACDQLIRLKLSKVAALPKPEPARFRGFESERSYCAHYGLKYARYCEMVAAGLSKEEALESEHERVKRDGAKARPKPPLEHLKIGKWYVFNHSKDSCGHQYGVRAR